MKAREGAPNDSIHCTVLFKAWHFRNVNIPWPHGHMNDADYIMAFQKIVMPIAYEFAPDFVIGTFCRYSTNGDMKLLRALINLSISSVCWVRRGERR